MNDDTLILYYYGDGLDEVERAAVSAAIENDAEVRERYRALCRSLERLDEPPEMQPPPQAVARWHRSIERVAAGERETPAPGRRWHLPSFAWGALAAALVLAFGIRAWFLDGTPPDVPGARHDGIADVRPERPAAVPVSFSRGLQVHLRASRQDLIHLPADAATDRRMLIMDIVRQNRLFERAARDNNAEDLARVLRAFEPVLQRLASEDLSAEDAAALKAKLTFELNVMLTKIAASESDETQSI